MAFAKDLEKSLDNIFVNKAPALPENAKKFIVQYLPWITLVAGLGSLWAAYTLWHWSQEVDRLVGYANSLGQLYGGSTARVEHLSPMIWGALLVLLAEAVIYILAYPAVRARRKNGWDLLFYALLVNFIYSIVVAFSDYGNGVGSIFGGLIGTAVGLYFLFQIRSEYLGTSKGSGPKPRTPTTPIASGTTS